MHINQILLSTLIIKTLLYSLEHSVPVLVYYLKYISCRSEQEEVSFRVRLLLTSLDPSAAPPLSDLPPRLLQSELTLLRFCLPSYHRTPNQRAAFWDHLIAL